jgi:hypothetical protein
VDKHITRLNGRDISSMLGAFRTLGINVHTLREPTAEKVLRKFEESALANELDVQSLSLSLFSLGHMEFTWEKSLSAVCRVALRNNLTRLLKTVTSKELYWTLTGLGKMVSFIEISYTEKCYFPSYFLSLSLSHTYTHSLAHSFFPHTIPYTHCS